MVWGSCGAWRRKIYNSAREVLAVGVGAPYLRSRGYESERKQLHSNLCSRHRNLEKSFSNRLAPDRNGPHRRLKSRINGMNRL